MINCEVVGAFINFLFYVRVRICRSGGSSFEVTAGVVGRGEEGEGLNMPMNIVLILHML